MLRAFSPIRSCFSARASGSADAVVAYLLALLYLLELALLCLVYRLRVSLCSIGFSLPAFQPSGIYCIQANARLRTAHIAFRISFCLNSLLRFDAVLMLRAECVKKNIEKYTMIPGLMLFRGTQSSRNCHFRCCCWRTIAGVCAALGCTVCVFGA